MLAFNQPSYAFRRAGREETGLVQYLRFASLVCLEMPAQPLQAVRSFMGGLPDVDAELIETGRYFVADLGGELVGGAGWSALRIGLTGERLVGEDGRVTQLVFQEKVALLRGFFLDPDLGRRGVGAALLAQVESEAARDGYRSLEIVAPATSQIFYRSLGFKLVRKLQLSLDRGAMLPLLQMRKALTVRLAVAA